MAAFIKLANSIITDHNGFLDPVNMGLDTKIKTTCASHTEIWANQNMIGGYLKI
jgi:hypothetical protein